MVPLSYYNIFLSNLFIQYFFTLKIGKLKIRNRKKYLNIIKLLFSMHFKKSWSGIGHVLKCDIIGVLLLKRHRTYI